jgi:hypothetical protein
VDGVNCSLDLLLLCHAARLDFPLEVRNHPPGDVAFHGFYGKLIGGLSLFDGKRLYLREQFGGQGDIGVRGHDHLIISKEIKTLIPDVVSVGHSTMGPFSISSPVEIVSAAEIWEKKHVGDTYGVPSSPQSEKSSPQRLKPELFSIIYVRAEARTLQKREFFRSLLG